MGIGREAAGADAVDADFGVPVAPAHADDAGAAPQGQAVFGVAGGALHLGALEVVAQVGHRVPPVEAGQHGGGDQHADGVVHDPGGVLAGEAGAGSPGPVAGEGEDAALGLAQDVVGGPVPAGAEAAEAAAPGQDDSGVHLFAGAVADLPAVEGAGPVVPDHEVGLLHQAVEDLLGFGFAVVQGDEVFVVVGALEGRRRAAARIPPGYGVEPGLVVRRAVAHGLTQAGHFDLDDLGPQFAQVGGGRRAPGCTGCRTAPDSPSGIRVSLQACLC